MLLSVGTAYDHSSHTTSPVCSTKTCMLKIASSNTYGSCLLILHSKLLCPWAIIPKSSKDNSKLVSWVGNVVAKHPVGENNNVLADKTSEVHSK